ncbi:HNH endonuclease signature motif containing protein [Paracoccus sp. MC1862]|uniref:HNH endonuclease signature motif containing protein n=1 Tax=Paracoccus sp. MC1862 TaxID=2760307 RepID=UPI00190B62C3|nr:HNH endonuclease signature motif containing protein [Paracoccus sp. MC1862]QQO43821.1 HNH endonuclease [Paracoccus sp. MC1862]
MVPPGASCPCQAKRAAERKARFDKTRPNSSQRGYDGRWEREAKAFLARRENSQCAACGAPAVVVMHIKSIRSRPELRMDQSNWRPGCQRCNAIEAARERRAPRKVQQ